MKNRDKLVFFPAKLITAHNFTLASNSTTGKRLLENMAAEITVGVLLFFGNIAILSLLVKKYMFDVYSRRLFDFSGAGLQSGEVLRT